MNRLIVAAAAAAAITVAVAPVALAEPPAPGCGEAPGFCPNAWIVGTGGDWQAAQPDPPLPF
jgi:hypothetical protein